MESIKNRDSIKSKVALVTGGTGVIGTAISQKLYDEGYQVVAGYFNGGDPAKAKRWQIQQQDAGRAIAINFIDVGDWGACLRCVLDIQETMGPISVLVNNAGITQDTTFKKMSAEQWSRVIQTNLDGVFNITRHVINQMIEQSHGRIINISSVNGQKGQFGQTNYSAAKAGLHGFTMALAQEVAKHGITVNTISPGYIASDMIEDMPKEILDKIISSIPVGRLGKPEEVARIVAFLAHEDSGFITGSNVSANGGQYMC